MPPKGRRMSKETKEKLRKAWEIKRAQKESRKAVSVARIASFIKEAAPTIDIGRHAITKQLARGYLYAKVNEFTTETDFASKNYASFEAMEEEFKSWLWGATPVFPNRGE